MNAVITCGSVSSSQDPDIIAPHLLPLSFIPAPSYTPGTDTAGPKHVG